MKKIVVSAAFMFAAQQRNKRAPVIAACGTA
jgi:hypothetical protein